MDWELIFWVVGGILALGGLIAIALPWNPCYERDSDPYKERGLR